jgi:NADPH-dependent 2,4-dienoyl-CoA reductase/sulfur reductase-like enzyme
VEPSSTFVIVGASVAGATAAVTLRDEGFDGRIVLIGEEPHPPCRPFDFYASNDIETHFGTRATPVDPQDGH